MGMRAATGAIAEVDISSGALVCHVLGNVPPRGICGSGLVDAAAACLDLGLLRPNGRLANNGAALVLSPPVQITQTDVRELQLAKGAIAAGVRILLRAMNTTPEKLARLYLAGAFGNYVNTTSAQRIGLLSFPTEKVRPSGNTALIGAKMGLFLNDAVFFDLARRIRHVTLSEQQDFQEIYVEEMNFPE
jgi:uncharacterized 2Fe-2S/4Fe-4S cluster protein (DUF4445 family)